MYLEIGLKVVWWGKLYNFVDRYKYLKGGELFFVKW